MKAIKFIILGIMLLSATVSFGQIGIRAGINMANEIKSFSWEDISESFQANNLVGYQIGVVQQVMFRKSNLGIEAGILLSQKGYTFIDNTTNNNCYKEINFLEIPLNLRCQVKLGAIGIFGYGGMYAAYSLGGKIVDESTNESQSINYPRFYDRLDYGYNIGAGVEFFKKIQLAGVWAQGLKNTSINPDNSSMNRVLSINLTYLF